MPSKRDREPALTTPFAALWPCILFGLVLLLTTPATAQPFALGPEERVFPSQSDTQTEGFISAAADGRFLIVWNEAGDLRGQFFDSEGAQAGNELFVSSAADGLQSVARLESIATHADGGFVVAWSSPVTGSYFPDVPEQYLRRFASDGSPVGDDLQVNQGTRGLQEASDIVTADDGHFVVVWQDSSYPSRSESIKGRRFASGGQALGGDFTISQAALQDHYEPNGAALGGDFLTVWRETFYASNEPQTLHGRLTAFDTGAMGVIERIDQVDGRRIGEPDVTAVSDGFLVVWDSTTTTGETLHELHTRRLDSNGTPVGDAILIRSATSQVTHPRLVTNNSDHVALVWTDPGLDGSYDSVALRLLDSTGAPTTEPILVNQWNYGSQRLEDVTASGGEFIILWKSTQERVTGSDFYMRRFGVDPNLFADGFESGDTSRWAPP